MILTARPLLMPSTLSAPLATLSNSAVVTIDSVAWAPVETRVAANRADLMTFKGHLRWSEVVGAFIHN